MSERRAGKTPIHVRRGEKLEAAIARAAAPARSTTQEERERFVQMAQIASEDAARMAARSRENGAWSLADDYELRATDWRKIAAILREPSGADAAGSGESGWWPIATAPVDGTSVLVSSPGDVVAEAHFVVDAGEWWLAQNDPSDSWGRALYPTHWMPLPAPPVHPNPREP